MGKLLILAGLLLVGVGVIVQMGVPLGRLPGDIIIRRGNSTFYFPIVTCLLLSLLFTLISWLFRK